MTVEMLMEILEDLDPDTEIRIAVQPNWPFEHCIEETSAVIEDEEEGTRILYLAAGNQIGYLSDNVREELDW